jgi:hypothetical protein
VPLKPTRFPLALESLSRDGTARLVEVEWDGKRVWMFGLDVATCCDRIA